eukprot:540641_1
MEIIILLWIICLKLLQCQHMSDIEVYQSLFADQQRYRSRPLRYISYEQQQTNELCPQGTRKCILTGINIKTLENVVFAYSIRELFIEGNSIRSLDNVQFPIGLITLSLARNKIVKSDAEYIDLSYLQTLTTLNLAHNRLTSLVNFKLPQTLRLLSLRNNNFQSINLGQNVYNLPVLYRLDLGLNKLTILTGDIERQIPSSVKVLKLDMNQIQSVEHALLPIGLERLDLSNNPLKSFDVTNIKQVISNQMHVQFEGTQLVPGQLEKKILLIPSFIWDKNKTSVEKECEICCEPIKHGEVIKTLACMHQYHCKCVDQWLGTHRSCPNCRHSINHVDSLPNGTDIDDSEDRSVATSYSEDSLVVHS